MESMKETGSNVAASARSGMEKTKATLQEKGEKLTAQNPMEKEMAREKKEDRKEMAEFDKQQTKEENAAAKQAHHHNSAGGGFGTGMGRSV